MKKQEKGPVLESSLMQAMKALDTQIAREMQRSPDEVDAHGVQKWEPIQKRIENTTSFIMNSLGDGDAGLDGVLVLAQAYTKALLLVIEDLGEDGLGKVRTGYCLHAAEALARDSYRMLQSLKNERQLT